MQPREALERAVAGSRRAFVAVGAFSLCANLLMLTVPVYMMQMFDRVLPSRNTDTLILLTLMAAVALGAMALLEGVRGRIMVRLGVWMDRVLSEPLLAGGMQDSLRGASGLGAGGLRELNNLRGFLVGAGIFPLLDAPWVPVFVAIIFLLHPWLGVVALVGAIVVFGFAVANDRLTRDSLQRANGAAFRAMYRADALVRNAEVVAAMGMMPDVTRRWWQHNQEGLTLQADASDKAGTITSAAKFFRMFLQIGMLGLGAFLVTRDQLTGGGMIAAAIILTRAMAPVEQSITAWRGLVSARGSFQSIRELLERTRPEGASMSLPAPQGRLQLEAVTFVPPGGREPIIVQLGFDLPAGSVLGLVGPSAAGKTTLARLIVGSWTPTAGHVRLDGADIAGWDPTDRGRHIGYLPQDVELFDGTVAENVARLREADPSLVVAAAQLARVHEAILHLPDGYDTQIGDGGVRLSGGQRQRIALARAIYGEPRLIVLDEPNASLDTEGERALAATIDDLKARGASVILITHRQTLLDRVDRILVLRQGRLDMYGPRDQVLAELHRRLGRSAPEALPAPAERREVPAAAESSGAPDRRDGAAPQPSPRPAQGNGARDGAHAQADEGAGRSRFESGPAYVANAQARPRRPRKGS